MPYFRLMAGPPPPLPPPPPPCCVICQPMWIDQTARPPRRQLRGMFQHSGKAGQNSARGAIHSEPWRCGGVCLIAPILLFSFHLVWCPTDQMLYSSGFFVNSILQATDCGLQSSKTLKKKIETHQNERQTVCFCVL